MRGSLRLVLAAVDEKGMPLKRVLLLYEHVTGTCRCMLDTGTTLNCSRYWEGHYRDGVASTEAVLE